MQPNPHVNAQSPQSTPITWAIAVHGGAGGDPAKWTGIQREARLSGIRAATQTGIDVLSSGGTALDAVEKVVRILEDDPAFNAGRGSVRTAADTVELDAAIMDGGTLRCGTVAGVTTPRHPITLARRVMTETRHVLLIGPGADRFAESQQVELVEPEFFRRSPDEPDQSLYSAGSGTTLGTVGCVALDSHGNLAAATSTGGVAGKMPGRVGDSPIIGAGTYADNATCAVSATGIGEEFIRHAIAYDIAAQMRYANRTLAEGVEHAIARTLKPDTGGVIAVDSAGLVVARHNTPGMTCGIADSSGRLEVTLRSSGEP